MADRQPQSRPPLSNPWVLIATWFGCGYLKPGPGTWGSLGALPFAWVFAMGAGEHATIALLSATVVAFLIGIMAADRFDALSGGHDASEIVVDEVAGIWLTLAFVPADPQLYAAGFILFRIFDILKPWPIRWADRRIGGGLGVMLDDILAAIPAAALLWVIERNLM